MPTFDEHIYHAFYGMGVKLTLFWYKPFHSLLLIQSLHAYLIHLIQCFG